MASSPINEKHSAEGLPLSIFYEVPSHTQYEKQNNIRPASALIILHDDPTIKIAITCKSDNTKTLGIIFKVGKNTEGWLRWCILDEQAEVMIQKFPDLFRAVKLYNKQHRRAPA